MDTANSSSGDARITAQQVDPIQKLSSRSGAVVEKCADKECHDEPAPNIPATPWLFNREQLREFGRELRRELSSTARRFLSR